MLYPKTIAAIFFRAVTVVTLLLVQGEIHGQAVQTMIYEEDFENGSFGPEWTPRPNLTGSSGSVQIVASQGVNSSFGMRLVRTVSGTDLTQNAADLKLSLAAYANQQVMLTFDIKDNRDETHLADALYISSNNGVTFHRVLDFNPDIWCDQFGQFPPIPLHSLAKRAGISLTNQFVIRFSQAGFQNPSFDGIYLDNIKIYVPDLEYFSLTPTSPFFDDFEIGTLRKHWAWRFADATALPIPGNLINQPSSIAEVVSGNGINNSFGLTFAKSCSDGYTAQAVDMHLDLSNNTSREVLLSFLIQDYRDETHADDAIFLSNDAGRTFIKILSFDPGIWCDQYGQFPPIPLRLLAKKAGMVLSDSCVVRFQHGGSQNSSFDGIYLDEVRVNYENLEYFSVNETTVFFDNFETGVLGKNWAWRFADSTAILTANSLINQPSGIANVISGKGRSNSFGLMFAKNCQDGYSTQTVDTHLKLGAVANKEVMLSFWISDNQDETHSDDAIFFSNDAGRTFKKIFEFDPSNWCDQYGQFPPVPLRQLAKNAGLTLSDSSIIRFQHGGTQNSSFDGVYIDEIKVYVAKPVYATLPLAIEDFESEIKPWQIHRFADSTATLLGGGPITRPSNRLEILNGEGRNNSRGLAFIKRCSDGPTTNAFDFQVNLLNRTNVVLDFYLIQYREETHIDDAIFLSNDGGKTFERIYNFIFSTPTNNIWQQYSLDLSALAASKGISTFSDSVIIRFQQHGRENSSFDGFFLDDLSITGNNSTATDPEMATAVKIFPNPSTGRFTVDIASQTAMPLHIRVFNQLGQEVMSTREMVPAAQWNLELDLSSQPSGIYQLWVEDGQHSTSQKLILAH